MRCADARRSPAQPLRNAFRIRYGCLDTLDAMSDVNHEPNEGADRESVSELLDQFGRDARALLTAELAYTASEHGPELRRAGRDAVATLVVGLAFLAAFALANVAAVEALSDVASGWRAPLLLAAGWAVVGVVLALALGVRTSRMLGISLSPGDD